MDNKKSEPLTIFETSLCATEQERADFQRLLSGDARKDFLKVFNLLMDAKEDELDKEFFEGKTE